MIQSINAAFGMFDQFFSVSSVCWYMVVCWNILRVLHGRSTIRRSRPLRRITEQSAAAAATEYYRKASLDEMSPPHEQHSGGDGQTAHTSSLTSAAPDGRMASATDGARRGFPVPPPHGTSASFTSPAAAAPGRPPRTQAVDVTHRLRRKLGLRERKRVRRRRRRRHQNLTNSDPSFNSGLHVTIWSWAGIAVLIPYFFGVYTSLPNKFDCWVSGYHVWFFYSAVVSCCLAAVYIVFTVWRRVGGEMTTSPSFFRMICYLSGFVIIQSLSAISEIQAFISGEPLSFLQYIQLVSYASRGLVDFVLWFGAPHLLLWMRRRRASSISSSSSCCSGLFPRFCSCFSSSYSSSSAGKDGDPPFPGQKQQQQQQRDGVFASPSTTRRSRTTAGSGGLAIRPGTAGVLTGYAIAHSVEDGREGELGRDIVYSPHLDPERRQERRKAFWSRLRRKKQQQQRPRRDERESLLPVDRDGSSGFGDGAEHPTNYGGMGGSSEEEHVLDEAELRRFLQEHPEAQLALEDLASEEFSDEEEESYFSYSGSEWEDDFYSLYQQRNSRHFYASEFEDGDGGERLEQGLP